MKLCWTLWSGFTKLGLFVNRPPPRPLDLALLNSPGRSLEMDFTSNCQAHDLRSYHKLKKDETSQAFSQLATAMTDPSVTRSTKPLQYSIKLQDYALTVSGILPVDLPSMLLTVRSKRLGIYVPFFQAASSTLLSLLFKSRQSWMPCTC